MTVSSSQHFIIVTFPLCEGMAQTLYNNDNDGINAIEDNEDDLETPTGENLFSSFQVRISIPNN